jgi:hypothetical protein
MEKKKIISYEEEGIGPLERGRRRYQQKDYSGALEAFTEVSSTLKLIPGPTDETVSTVRQSD